MASIKFPKPAKLVVGLISGEEDLFTQIKVSLIKKFGKIDFESETLPFNHTDYYKDEFGENLKRKFFSFKRLIDPGKLKNIKLYILRLERKCSKDGRRKINIDPGYLALSKLVLSTTKDYFHRVYLGKGIFAEVTLHFQDKTFQGFEWTYPDYRSKAYIEIFNKIREILRSQIKNSQ